MDIKHIIAIGGILGGLVIPKVIDNAVKALDSRKVDTVCMHIRTIIYYLFVCLFKITRLNKNYKSIQMTTTLHLWEVLNQGNLLWSIV